MIIPVECTHQPRCETLAGCQSQPDLFPPLPASPPNLVPMFPEITPSRALRASLGIMSAEDLATALEVTEETLATWRKNGGGPTHAKLGKAIFYRVLDIYDWINASRELRVAA